MDGEAADAESGGDRFDAVADGAGAALRQNADDGLLLPAVELGERRAVAALKVGEQVPARAPAPGTAASRLIRTVVGV